jgi:hypothetical protein
VEDRKFDIRVQVSGVRDVAAAMRVGMAALHAGTQAIVDRDRDARAPKREDRTVTAS